MAAPALVALAHGSRDPRSAKTITALVNEVRTMRPDLRIEPAFLELSRPSFATVVDRLVKAGHDEIVVVPLLLSEAYHAKVDVPSAVAEAAARHEGVQIRATSVLGFETSFLEVLDVRMREALKASRVRELDALVLAAAGSSDPLANQAVARLARVWGSRHKLPVTAAFASSAPPATGEAVRAFRAQGRRHIAVASLFLAPGFLPDRAAELALEAGADRGLGATGGSPRARPHGAGPLRRRCGRAGPRLTADPSLLVVRRALTRHFWSFQTARSDGSADELLQEVLQLPGRVGGEPTVHGARLEDRALRGPQEAEPRADRLAGRGAAPLVPGADALDELQRGAHVVDVEPGVERLAAAPGRCSRPLRGSRPPGSRRPRRR